MIYHSVNGHAAGGKRAETNFTGAMFSGLAPDGGLYVPAEFPVLSRTFLDRPDHTLHSIGAGMLTRFIDEIDSTALTAIIEQAWQFPVPLVQLEKNLFVLELFHGPTHAFKDIGAKFMAGVMSHVLRHEQRDVAILVATSGDTGSAVAHGFYDAPHITVFVLYPSGQISPLQERQMTTLGGNIHALEVKGTFDDCQRMVKQAFADSALSARRSLTTANSINVARLLPQTAYFGWTIHQLHEQLGDRFKSPMVVVPSGNFGNLTAGVYAKAVGWPILGFLAATNANDVVPIYLRSGEFHPRPSRRTFSNAMDVGDPSNLARIVAYYGNLERLRQEIAAVSIDDDETLAEIARTYDRYKYLADPHTAVALASARASFAGGREDRPVIILATAHPAKFREVIRKAISVDVPLPRSLEDALTKTSLSTRISAEQGELSEYLLNH